MNQAIPIKTIDVDNFKGTVCVCWHCGERFGSSNGTCAMMCKNCRTAEGRKAIDAENEEIWAKEGKEFHCRYCEAMAVYKNQ